MSNNPLCLLIGFPLSHILFMFFFVNFEQYLTHPLARLFALFILPVFIAVFIGFKTQDFLERKKQE